ncbi:MAG TPA: prolipoprotein diacylglyceryl transferase family protein [Anaeromyxobacteraceae bacterium]|nr:prolipoprotein diacylglyceryl transferase family protein [Anaeromyxobacteraceae bacterium]
MSPAPLAVIPWFELPSLDLGPFHIQSFGVLSALGILAAVQIAAKLTQRVGRDPQVILDFAVSGVLTGILAGHFVHLFFYHPEELRDPWRILKFWEGLSSMGGLLGGILAAAVFFRRRKLRFHDFGDPFAVAVATGWGVARVGCFTVHDHPGVLTDFPLAVAFPGGARHDLGLYEAIILFALGGLLYLLFRRGALRGRLLPLLALLYGVSRFLLDFLRARDIDYADARYLGLTPAQWITLGLMAYAVWGFATLRAPAPAAAAAPKPRPRSSRA